MDERQVEDVPLVAQVAGGELVEERQRVAVERALPQREVGGQREEADRGRVAERERRARRGGARRRRGR
jgi:hypothetical protein